MDNSIKQLREQMGLSQADLGSSVVSKYFYSSSFNAHHFGYFWQFRFSVSI